MASNQPIHMPNITSRCRYMSGDSARPQMAMVEISNNLTITKISDTGDSEIIACWAFDDLRSHDGPAHILMISNARNEQFERLEIHNKEAISAIKIAAPNLGKYQKAEHSKSRKIAALSIAALLSAVVIIIMGIPYAADQLAPLVPLSAEKKLGDSVNKQIARAFGHDSLEDGTCHTPEGDAALAKMLKVAQQDTALPFEVNLRVFRNEIPNAFALPGGNVMIFSELIKIADHPDQVTGVLAHELGHVKHRDGMRLIIQTTGRSFFLSTLLGDFTGSTILLFGVQTMLNSSYSRKVENQADIFAVQQLKKANVATKPLGELLQKITSGDDVENKNEEKQEAALWDSHPLTADRMALLSKSETNENTTPSLSDKEWQALKNICQ